MQEVGLQSFLLPDCMHIHNTRTLEQNREKMLVNSYLQLKLTHQQPTTDITIARMVISLNISTS